MDVCVPLFFISVKWNGNVLRRIWRFARAFGKVEERDIDFKLRLGISKSKRL
jgi:hypothetical protein